MNTTPIRHGDWHVIDGQLIDLSDVDDDTPPPSLPPSPPASKRRNTPPREN